MLDRLLGRAELKERVAELEEANHHLQRRVDAEEERRAEAVTDRQTAEERVNRQADRIEELEDRVDRLSGEEAAPEFRRVRTLPLEESADLRRRLAGVETAPEGALTAFVPDGDSVPDAVADWFDDRTALVRRAAPALIVADDDALVSAAIELPLAPVPFCEWRDGFRVEASWLRPTGRFAFGLVRADTFAVGVYEGTDRVAVEGFESDVKAAHSKGGFSQDRFERRREGQIDDHLDDVRETLSAVAADHDLDRTVLVGDERVLSAVRDLADVTDVTDASGDPEPALADAFRDFWTVRIYGI